MMKLRRINEASSTFTAPKVDSSAYAGSTQGSPIPYFSKGKPLYPDTTSNFSTGTDMKNFMKSNFVPDTIKSGPDGLRATLPRFKPFGAEQEKLPPPKTIAETIKQIIRAKLEENEAVDASEEQEKKPNNIKKKVDKVNFDPVNNYTS